MKSTTTDQQVRNCPDLLQVATGSSAAKARTITAAIVLALMALLSGCASAPTEASSPAPTTAAAAAPASAPAPASTPAALPDVPIRQATPTPAAPKDPAPRSLTVEGTTINM